MRLVATGVEEVLTVGVDNGITVGDPYLLFFFDHSKINGIRRRRSTPAEWPHSAVSTMSPPALLITL